MVGGAGRSAPVRWWPSSPGARAPDPDGPAVAGHPDAAADGHRDDRRRALPQQRPRRDRHGAGRRRVGADRGTYGSGRRAVVLLHQTGAGGFCGWVPYARWLGERGVVALAVDDCLHGASRCTDATTADVRAQVAAAVDWARGRGAERVAVVGASMGGSRALGVGQAAGADAVVDLSGPERWEGVPDAAAAARATTVPLLVVSSDGDGGIDGDVLDARGRGSPSARKDRVRLEGAAHGWDVVTEGIGDDAEVTDRGPWLLRWVEKALDR